MPYRITLGHIRGSLVVLVLVQYIELQQRLQGVIVDASVPYRLAVDRFRDFLLKFGLLCVVSRATIY
jgi:hypothetical protein